MSRVVCEIALSKGSWSFYPHPSRVLWKLRQVFTDSLLTVTFHDPSEDNVVEVEIDVEGNEDDCDWISDTIFKTFFLWKPEYESMVEVSLAID